MSLCCLLLADLSTLLVDEEGGVGVGASSPLLLLLVLLEHGHCVLGSGGDGCGVERAAPNVRRLALEGLRLRQLGWLGRGVVQGSCLKLPGSLFAFSQTNLPPS